MRSICTTSAFGIAFFATGLCAASGLSTARFGAEQGTPMATNPTAIYYNPAGLAAAEHDIDLFVDVNAAWRVASYERPPIAGCEAGVDPSDCPHPREIPEPSDAVGANNSSASLTNFAAAPMLGANLRIPLPDDFALAVGGGFFVPFGGQSSWGQSEAFEGSRYPGPVDGPQRWWSIDGTLRSLFVSGAIAADFAGYAQLGVSAGAAITQVNTIRARTALGNNALPDEGRTWLDAESVDPQLGVGLLVTPLGNRDLRIGASYQAPVGFDGVRVRGLLAKKIGRGPITDNTPGEDDVEMTVAWPDSVRFGVGYRFNETIEARLFGNFTRWSLFDDNCIAAVGERCEVNEDGTAKEGEDGTPANVINNVPRRWQDAGGVRAGVSYWLNPDIELLVGVGYDSNAIPDATLAPDILDFHDISASVGGRFTIIDQLAANLTYTQFFYIDREITPQENQNATFEGNSKGPSSHGSYGQHIGVVNLNVEVMFDPFEDEPAEGEELPAGPTEETPPADEPG